MFVKLKLLLYFLVAGVILASCAPLEQLCEPNVSDENSDVRPLSFGEGVIWHIVERRGLCGDMEKDKTLG